MKYFLVLIILFIASVVAFGQGKGIDTQGQRITDNSSNKAPANNGTKTNVGTTGSGINFGKDKTPEHTMLPNPYRLTARRDVIIKAVAEVMRDRKQIQLIGHALEAINYGLLHKLFTLTPNQKKRVLDGERALYEYLVKLRATDLGPFNNWYSKFVSDMVIAMAHASRALKLLTPGNPDTAA